MRNTLTRASVPDVLVDRCRANVLVLPEFLPRAGVVVISQHHSQLENAFFPVNVCSVQSGRSHASKAFLMELDPLYCEVIVQRFEQFTGKRAERMIRTESDQGSEGDNVKSSLIRA